MFENLMGYYAQFMAFANTNPIFGSAVFMSVFGAIVISFKNFLFNVPGKIWDVTSRVLYSTAYYRKDYRWNDDASHQFNTFMQWYATTKAFKLLVRNYRPITIWKDGRRATAMAAGLGTYPFIWKGSFGFFRHTETQSDTTIYGHLTVYYFGSAESLTGLMGYASEFDTILDAKTHISLRRAGKEGNWNRIGKIRKRDLNSVITSNSTTADIIQLIDSFKQNESWYLERGIPYKLIIVLEGPPGTGKTSLIRAIASHYSADLYASDIAALPECLPTIDDDGIVYVEDFDTDSTVHSRDEVPGSEDRGNVLSAAFMGLNLTDILNAVDGMTTPHGLIMFMTTNHIEKIDSAVIRDERVDRIFHVGLLDHADICRYISRFYPGTEIPLGVEFVPTAGSRLQKLLKRHPNDGKAFIADLLADGESKLTLTKAG